MIVDIMASKTKPTKKSLYLYEMPEYRELSKYNHKNIFCTNCKHRNSLWVEKIVDLDDLKGIICEKCKTINQ